MLPGRKLPTLRSDITLIPAAGVSKLLPLASMLVGHDVEIGALLDGDEPARREGRKLVEKLLSGKGRRCLFIGDFVDGFTNAELEDVFPDDYYLSAVQVAYPNVNTAFNKEETELSGIVNKLTTFFDRKGLGKFEKWRVAAVLRDWILEKPNDVPVDVYATMSKIFEAANAAFANRDTEE